MTTKSKHLTDGETNADYGMPEDGYMSPEQRVRATMTASRSATNSARRKRPAMVSFRVTDEELRELHRRAAERGQSVGQVLRDAAFPPGLNLYARSEGPPTATITGPVPDPYLDLLLMALHPPSLLRTLRRLLRKHGDQPA